MSSCLDPKPPHKPAAPDPLVIGSDFTIDFFLQDRSSRPSEPVDLTGATEIVVIFLKDDDTFDEIKLSDSDIVIVDAINGHFKAMGNSTDYKPSGINAVPATEPSYSDVEVHVTIGGKTQIVLFPQSINLVPRLFPTAP